MLQGRKKRKKETEDLGNCYFKNCFYTAVISTKKTDKSLFLRLKNVHVPTQFTKFTAT